MKAAGLAIALAWMLCASAVAATDPQGDSTDTARDIVAYTVSVDQRSAIVTVEVAGNWDFDAVQILIDTQASKGFAVGGIGADLMIEGATLYRYNGKGEDWTWQRLGEVRRAVAGRKLTTHISRDHLQSGTASFIIRTLTSDWQTVLDTAPDAQAAKLALGETTDNAAAPAIADATRDITDFTAAQEGDEVVFTITARQGGDFATYLLFIDTDLDADTGFQPPADPRFGFEMLVSGDRLHKHNGATRDAWQWEGIGPAKISVDDNKMTIRVQAGLFQTAELGAAAWAMSEDWQTRVDLAPAEGLKRLKVDAKPVAPRAAAQMAPPKANRHLPARQRVQQAESFYCYYGSSRVAELSHYDVVILHTPQMASEDVKRLSELGVVTIGYITVGEDDPREARKGDGTGPGGYASWYFDDDNDGQPDRNPIWRSYYTNANDPNWRADRVAEARRLVEEYGFDGIFLDTLDTATARPHTKPGMIQLVTELREALPDAPIILNQGFSMLPELAPLADGLMLESFTATYDFDSRTYMMNYPQSIDWHLKRVQSEILPVIEKHPLKVLVLDYAPENEVERIQQAANRAATFGFLFAAAPIYLDDVYQLEVTGQPDPKWLQKMTTPQMLSLKLDKSANGFPAGTVLLPSSAFAGYTIAPVVDGIEDRSNLHWSKAAWASAEDGETAWLEVQLPQARQGGTIRIDFEPSHPSQTFFIETRPSDDAAWEIVHTVTDNTNGQLNLNLPNQPYKAIRIRQEPGGGSPARPDLMWIAQLYLMD